MLQPKLDRPAEAAAAALYERDTVLWAEQQAERLRQAAAGKRPAGIDWANLIEEIESVGRSLVNAVESLLLQALVHEFKAALWPDTPYVEGWRNESLLFQVQAAGQFMPSMQQKIDASKLVQRAMRAVPPTIDGTRQRSNKDDLSQLSVEAILSVKQWLDAPDSGLSIRLTHIESDFRRDQP